MATPNTSTMFQSLAMGHAHWNNWIPKQSLAEIDLRGLDFSAVAAPDHFTQHIFPFPVNFTGARFPANFRFDDARFYCPVTFEGATFEGGATFVATRFDNSAKLDHARFLGLITFRNAQFQDLSAHHAKFDGEAFFGGGFSHHCMFNHARFSEAAWFECNFSRGASFNHAKFGKDVRFSNSTFGASSAFQEASFDGKSDFSDMKFARDVTFDTSVFGGPAYFLDATFGGVASFVKVTFEADVNFSARLNVLDFHEFWLRDVKFKGRSDFLKRRFTRNTSLTGASFAFPPQLHDSEMHQDTSFDGADFGSTKDEASERSFRTLKLQMSKQQNHLQELVFFGLEMESRRVTVRSLWTKSLLTLYKLLSNYGQSIARPIGLLFVTVVGFFALYGQTTVGWDALRACLIVGNCSVVVDRAKSAEILQFTLSQSVPFIGLFKESKGLFESVPMYVQFFALLQAFMTILFAFLIGLGLRNLFRLR